MRQMRRNIKVIGLKQTIIYFVFQKIFRINSNVPWPVHWSSIVYGHKKISRKCPDRAPFPGYMPGCYIQAINGIEIGENVRMGPGIKIISSNHDVNDYSIHVPCNPVIIEDNCWLCANSIILPGVHIGEHTVVAAGAVVNKSYPEGNQVLGGVPAVVIKKLCEYNTIGRSNIDA